MLVGQGAGGETAAPVARIVLRGRAALADALDVEVDRCRPLAAGVAHDLGARAGGCRATSILILNSISAPWIGLSEAAESSCGISSPARDRRGS